MSSLTTPLATSNVTSISNSKENPIFSSKAGESLNQLSVPPLPTQSKQPQNNNTGASTSYWIEEKIKLLKQI